jgi:hypothetical protein
MILMAAAKAAGEAAVFPGMIQVIVRVAAAGIVANPIVIVVDVRGVRMIGPIAEGATVVLRAAFLAAIFRAAILLSVILGRAILRSVRRRTVRGNMAAPNIVSTTAALASALSTSAAGWDKHSRGEREEQREQGGEVLHDVLRNESSHGPRRAGLWLPFTEMAGPETLVTKNRTPRQTRRIRIVCATKTRESEGFGGAEGADYGGGVALVGVDFGIQVAHFFGGDFVG